MRGPMQKQGIASLTSIRLPDYSPLHSIQHSLGWHCPGYNVAEERIKSNNLYGENVQMGFVEAVVSHYSSQKWLQH